MDTFIILNFSMLVIARQLLMSPQTKGFFFFLHLVVAYFSISLIRFKHSSGKIVENYQQQVEQLLILLHCGSNILKLLIQCFTSKNVLFCISGEI